jgi:hypothetical protein
MRFWPDEDKREKVFLWVSIFTVLAFLASWCAFAYSADVIAQLTSMLLTLIFIIMWLISFITALTRWSTVCWVSFVVFILAFPGCSQAIKAGHWARMKVFEHRLPSYEKAVQQIIKNFDGQRKLITKNNLPEECRRFAYYAYVYKDNNNATVVNFMWGIGFPVKHTAFVWRSDGVLPEKGTEFRRDWPGCWRINEHWFRCSD